MPLTQTLPLTRRTLLANGLTTALAAAATSALAHHGLMIWDRDNPVTLKGLVSSEMDGFPHWEAKIRVDSEDWVIDLGSDFDLERAGLSTDGREFTIGAAIEVTGYRPKDSDTRLLRPKSITLDGTTYTFTTDWD